MLCYSENPTVVEGLPLSNNTGTCDVQPLDCIGHSCRKSGPLRVRSSVEAVWFLERFLRPGRAEPSQPLPSDAGHSLADVGLIRRLLTPRTGVFVLAALALVAIMAGTKSWSNVAYMYRDRFEGTSTIGPHEDYVAFYAAGRMVREGHGGSLYDVDAIGLVERESMGRFVGGTGCWHSSTRRS